LSHSMNLTELIPNSTYFYRISSCSSAGNCSNSTILNFTTYANPFPPIPQNDTTPPVISNLVIIKNSNSASIFFNTNEPANNTINSGISQALGTIIFNSAPITNHLITLSTLVNNTLYYYNLTVCDVSGNCGSLQGNFTTDNIQTEIIHEHHYTTKKTKEIVYSGLSEETEEEIILRQGTAEPLILSTAEEKTGKSWLYIFLIILFGLLILLLIILIIWASSY